MKVIKIVIRRHDIRSILWLMRPGLQWQLKIRENNVIKQIVQQSKCERVGVDFTTVLMRSDHLLHDEWALPSWGLDDFWRSCYLDKIFEFKHSWNNICLYKPLNHSNLRNCIVLCKQTKIPKWKLYCDTNGSTFTFTFFLYFLDAFSDSGAYFTSTLL